MKKRQQKILSKLAQVSSFIIIALIIVILAGIFIFLNTSSSTFNIGARNVDPTIQPIHIYVQNCLAEVGVDAIEHISQRGGYHKTPNPKTELEVPYYIKDAQGYVPPVEKIELELSSYISNNLEICIDYSSFSDFSITPGDIKIQTNILDDKINFDADYSLSITKAEKSYQLRRFEASLPVRLKTIHEVAEDIVLNEINELVGICISCIDFLVTEKDLKIVSIDYDDNTLIYSLVDENTNINDNNHVFNFAIEYDFPDDL